MSVVNLNVLKARFTTGDRPSAKDFVDLIDTLLVGGNSSSGLTEGQAVFVGTVGNLMSKNATDARAALGVLSAGTKAAGGANDQIPKNHGDLVSGQPAIWDGTGWLTKTVDEFLSALGVGNKFAFYSSGAIAKGAPPITTTLTQDMSFAQPSGATHWTEIEVYGECFVATDATPTDASISFIWQCGDPLVTAALGVSATEGCIAALADLGLVSERESVHTHYIGVVPVALRETFPLIIRARYAPTHDTTTNQNWNVAGKATAR